MEYKAKKGLKVEHNIKKLFRKLTGQCIPNNHLDIESIVDKKFNNGGISHSQFNEICLILGYDRVSIEFFNYLADPEKSDSEDMIEPNKTINSYEQLITGIENFREFALLFFGNIKFAYKNLSTDVDALVDYLIAANERDIEHFRSRNTPMIPIQKIKPEDTYYLGYYIQDKIKKKLKDSPQDKGMLEKKQKMEEVIEIGKKNNCAYLFSDHLDIYIATSMRLPHEFICISNFASELFNSDKLKDMKLRWFDPTQAYCSNRIDKGLSEALMLKRAKCTLYLAQESDTLGKDSELASTLAQGKPVIAYIPIVDYDYIDGLITSIQTNSDSSIKEIMLEQMQIFDSSLAWNDPEIKEWIANLNDVDEITIKEKLKDIMKLHYDKRAKTLKDIHPLGIQVNLATGVANGVLVVRTISECSELIRNILTQTMDFEVEEKVEDDNEYLFLRERITKCVFRVMTGDTELTNAFWNFYLDN